MKVTKLEWFRDEREVTSDGTRFDYRADVLVGRDHWSFEVIRIRRGLWHLYGTRNGQRLMYRTHDKSASLRGQAEHAIARLNREGDTT